MQALSKNAFTSIRSAMILLPMMLTFLRKILLVFLIWLLPFCFTAAHQPGPIRCTFNGERLQSELISGFKHSRYLLWAGSCLGAPQLQVSRFVFSSDSHSNSDAMSKNQEDHIWLYAVILGLVIICSTFFMFRRIRLLRERLENERRFAELQFKTLRNQLAPHFIFNALNAIGSSIYQNDKEKAYDFLQRFATLIRTTLIHADKTYRTLNEEIEFVKNYLDLEQFRFENKFEYIINIQEGVDLNSPVPKMIIQTFAENSVIHGLVQKSGRGLLSILLNTEQNYLTIIVEDNGIGRITSKQNNVGSTGKGMEIINEFITLFNRFNEKKIHFEVHDIYSDSGIIDGTRVTVKLPINYTYNSISKTI